MIFTLHREKYTCIIKVNPFHDDTAADEKYQFTCVEKINLFQDDFYAMSWKLIFSTMISTLYRGT
jgi:hypothetical protein